MPLDALTAYGWQGAVLLVWVALSVGSFLNVVIYRLPVMLKRDWRQQATEILVELDADAAPAQALDLNPAAEPEPRFNLMVPRSRCPVCEHQITAIENIPVVSWLFLRGRCRACRTPIAVRYPAIELLTALMSVAVIMTFGFTPFGIAACFYTWLLIALTFIDYDTKLLPDQMTLPLLWLGLLANMLTQGVVPLQDAVIGAVAGYLFLWSTYWVFKLITGKDGMGYGDFKLLGALGAWLGWQALPSIILIAAVVGLIYALGRIGLRKQTSAESIPFGPFLATAGWVCLIFRDNVLSLFLP